MSAIASDIRYLLGHARPPQESYLRGSVDARIASHVVMVTTRTGAQLLRRVSLSAIQMGQLEARLMLRQHAGDNLLKAVILAIVLLVHLSALPLFRRGALLSNVER